MDLPQLPIWQAPTGSIAGPELCAAISNSGGVGAMGLTWTEPNVAAGWVRQVRSQTDGLFQVNFVLHFEPKALTAVLEAGAPIITFSWGLPIEQAKVVKDAGAGLGIQVVSRRGAQVALELEPDFLVCQGIEAGGHVQSSTPLGELLPQVLEVAGEIPVIAAGGISVGHQIRTILDDGAAGAMLGTRFVATQESRAHPTYKRILADQSDTALTICFDGGWPNAPHRVIRNSTYLNWEAAGSPREPGRPGEGDEIGRIGVEPVRRYEDTAPRAGMEGKIEAMCLYAGTGVADIQDIPPVQVLMERLRIEAGL